MIMKSRMAKIESKKRDSDIVISPKERKYDNKRETRYKRLMNDIKAFTLVKEDLTYYPSCSFVEAKCICTVKDRFCQRFANKEQWFTKYFGCEFAKIIDLYFELPNQDGHSVFKRLISKPMQTHPLALKDNRVTLALLKARSDFDILAKLLGRKTQLNSSLIEKE